MARAPLVDARVDQAILHFDIAISLSSVLHLSCILDGRECLNQSVLPSLRRSLPTSIVGLNQNKMYGVGLQKGHGFGSGCPGNPQPGQGAPGGGGPGPHGGAGGGVGGPGGFPGGSGGDPGGPPSPPPPPPSPPYPLISPLNAKPHENTSTPNQNTLPAVISLESSYIECPIVR